MISTNLRVWYLRNPIVTQLSRRCLISGGADLGHGARIKRSLRIDNSVTDENSTGDFSHLSIGSNTYIGDGVYMDLADKVDIGQDVTVGGDVSFITHADCNRSQWLSDHFPRDQGAITVNEGAWIGFGATIMHGVTVGRKSVVAAGSLVREDVEPQTVVAGTPAEPVRKLEDPPSNTCDPGEHEFGFQGYSATYICENCGIEKDR